jgi:hypothetical protein
MGSAVTEIHENLAHEGRRTRRGSDASSAWRHPVGHARQAHGRRLIIHWPRSEATDCRRHPFGGARAVDKHRLTRASGRLSAADLGTVEDGVRRVLDL